MALERFKACPQSIRTSRYVPAGTFRTVPEHSTSYRNITYVGTQATATWPDLPEDFQSYACTGTSCISPPWANAFMRILRTGGPSFSNPERHRSGIRTCFCLAMITIRSITIIIIIILHQALVIPSISAASFCSLCILSSGRPQGCQPKSLLLPTSGLSTQIRIVGDLKVVNPYLQSQPSGLTTQPT